MKRSSGALACAAVFVFAVLSGHAFAQQQEAGLGFVPEPEGDYQSFQRAPRFRAFLPPAVDLSDRFPTPGSQGRQGSCVAWAVGYSLRSYYEGKRRNWTSFGPERVASPAFIYNHLHNYDGDCSKGTAISAALEFLKNEGTPTLAAFPYVAADCSRAPAPEVRATASDLRIRSWQSLQPKKLDDVKGQLARGNPVVFGMDISDSFNRVKAGDVYDDLESPRIGGHAMVIVGYNEEKQAFKLINSWGTRWGEGGFGWVSYRAVNELSNRLFVMDVAPVDDPPPPPPPPVAVVKPPPPVVKPEPVPLPNPAPAPPVVVITPIPPPVPVLSDAEFRKLVEARVAQTACSRLQAGVSADRSISLRGFAGGGDELAGLRKDLLALQGAKSVDAQVDLYPWPQCEVLLNFAQPLAAASAPQVAAARLLRAGDSLELEITTPSYPSHLYVTYLQASGEAVHLYWPQGRFPKALPPGSRVKLGGGKGGEPMYRVGAPFGDEVIVVVASKSPLFQGAPGETATDREYLTTFRRAFAASARDGSGQRVVSAAAVMLKTEAK